MRTGLVVRIDAKRCHVEVDDEVLLLSPRGRLFRDKGPSRNPIAVGDRVSVTLDGSGGGSIDRVLPRRTQLTRQSAGEGRQEQVLVANVDRALVVTSVKDPPFLPHLVDRILAGAERGGIDAHLVLNKIDLVPGIPGWRSFYEKLGYPVHLTSARTGAGISGLTRVLEGHITVFLGPSGAGKSALLNCIEPGLSLQVGEISRRWREGKHTTTHSSLLRLGAGGHVVDTPGLRNFGLFGLEPRDLATLFREFRPHLGSCTFKDCLHRQEPDCAVIAARSENRISASRYASYLEVLADSEGGSLDR
ncbi:MAG: ribosome small subunit-dependent GTPase A [Planctomycetota bacterium]